MKQMPFSVFIYLDLPSEYTSGALIFNILL
jgi:hypothetical protein